MMHTPGFECNDYERTLFCEFCVKRQYNKCTSYTAFYSNCSTTTCENLNENPCFNGGTCVTEIVKDQFALGFKCECADGFYGELCLSFDACYHRPCQFNELCFNYGELGHYFCVNDKFLIEDQNRKLFINIR